MTGNPAKPTHASTERTKWFGWKPNQTHTRKHVKGNVFPLQVIRAVVGDASERSPLFEKTEIVSVCNHGSHATSSNKGHWGWPTDSEVALAASVHAIEHKGG